MIKGEKEEGRKIQHKKTVKISLTMLAGFSRLLVIGGWTEYKKYEIKKNFPARNCATYVASLIRRKGPLK